MTQSSHSFQTNLWNGRVQKKQLTLTMNLSLQEREYEFHLRGVTEVAGYPPISKTKYDTTTKVE